MRHARSRGQRGRGTLAGKHGCMWLAEKGMERERENMHRLYAGLLAAGLGAGPEDLEAHPEIAGACVVPAQKADMSGLWARIDNRPYTLRAVLRGRARFLALAAALADMPDCGRELAWWCVGAMVLMGDMELDPRV